MKNKELISIIVPVYKVEKYLNRCIDSLINQTYKDIEILLIDDGSPDNCPQICDDYAKMDRRIKVFHKKNGGLSDARNYGIEKCQGTYITFVDSDDYVNDEMVELLYRSLIDNKCDISICMSQMFSDKDDVIIDYSDNQVCCLSKNDALEKMLYHQIYHSSWGKLFKKSLFNNIRFPVGKIMEDLATSYLLFYNSSRIVVNSRKLYYYYQREDSIMHNSFSLKQLDGVEAVIEETSFIKENIPALYKAAICNEFRCAYENLIKIPKKNKSYIKEYKNIKNLIKKDRYIVLFDHKAPKKYRIMALISCISVNILVFIQKEHKKNIKGD